ncbi:MAG: hypothetical protein FWD73_17625 [Polyangiaceae bacterium]|nr:hypothetical protein [Polyangiaceae bacterium]
MKTFSIGRLLVAVGCLASCGGAFGDAPGSSDGGSGQTNGGTGSDGGGLDGGFVDPGPVFSFVQAQSPVYVRQGQEATSIPITIARNVTPGNDIQITITSVPDGVSVAPTQLTIPSGSTTGQLAINVDPSISQGLLDGNLVLQGSAEAASATEATNLQLTANTSLRGCSTEIWPKTANRGTGPHDGTQTLSFGHDGRAVGNNERLYS